jgi:hypothetical protein
MELRDLEKTVLYAEHKLRIESGPTKRSEENKKRSKAT